MAVFLGIDLGGTNIKVGIVDGNGEPLTQLSLPTPQTTGEDVLAAMAGGARDAAQRIGMTMEEIAMIGVGVPGAIDFEQGIVEGAPNLPGFNGLHVGRHMRELTGRPTVVENDANAAAFGEYWTGAGRDRTIRHMVMLTLGTGIGTGLITDGKLIHGHKGLGGEGGHMIVHPRGRPCGCGQRGCLEQYASATACARRAREDIAAGKKTSLQGLDPITSKEVFEHAKAGDALSERIAFETAEYLALACVNLCRLFDPQMIVFAGGMIAAGEYLFDRVRRVFDDLSWSIAEDHVRIVPAELGNQAGFIGAAGVAWQQHQQTRGGS